MVFKIVLPATDTQVILNPSVWEYQSAELGYNYDTARQSSAATVQ